MVLWFFAALLVISSFLLFAAGRAGKLPAWMRKNLINGVVALSVVWFGLVSWQTFAPPPAPQWWNPFADSVRADELPGAKTFAGSGCPKCHSIGAGKKTGPDLAGVGSRMRERDLARFIFDPEEYYRAKDIASLNHGYPKMPTIGISEAAAGDIAEFLVARTREASKK